MNEDMVLALTNKCRFVIGPAHFSVLHLTTKLHASLLMKRRYSKKKTSQSSATTQQAEVHTVAVTDVTENILQSHADTVIDAAQPLSVLLEQEDLLQKVLSFVAEDGLHECRRVCRRWREACGKVPVKIRRVRPDELGKVADLFPKTSSLTIYHWLKTANAVEKELIPHLTRLRDLNQLDLSLSKMAIDVNPLLGCLPSMQRLRMLCIRVGREDTLHDVVHVLRRLENLLSLDLSVDCVIQRDLEPVAELQGLKELVVDIQVLFNSRHELLLPSLTGLVHLTVGHFPYKYPPPSDFHLQVCQSLHASIFSLNVFCR